MLSSNPSFSSGSDPISSSSSSSKASCSSLTIASHLLLKKLYDTNITIPSTDKQKHTMTIVAKSLCFDNSSAVNGGSVVEVEIRRFPTFDSTGAVVVVAADVVGQRYIMLVIILFMIDVVVIGEGVAV